MEFYLKKYFWTLPMVVVCVCAVFAAKGVNHYLEGELLGDAKQAPPVAVRAKTKPVSKKRSKSSAALATRNMFCSDCLPTPEETAPANPSGEPPVTSLPLRLVATHLSTLEAESFATILNTSSKRQGAYEVGGEIPDAGEIVRISGKFVDFRNEKTRRTERLALLAKRSEPRAEARAKPKKKPKKNTRRSRRAELLAMIDEGVTKIDDNTFELDREVVNKVLENPARVARGARIVPSIKNGKANGFKLYAIRPSSVYAKLGLRNGDTIHSINGFELSSPDKALEVYLKLREANSLSVNATRRGKPVTLDYTIK